jgi:hypothetical protein
MTKQTRRQQGLPCARGYWVLLLRGSLASEKNIFHFKIERWLRYQRAKKL